MHVINRLENLAAVKEVSKNNLHHAGLCKKAPWLWDPFQRRIPKSNKFPKAREEPS
jgi:hypothetical protein